MNEGKQKNIKIIKLLTKNLFLFRYNIDAVEKQTLQNALDNLQNNIQIKNRAQIVDRIESITRRSSLKFTDNANTNSLFISSDMFYVEILLDPSGKINDVKVHHESSNDTTDSSEPHLVEVLRKGDFVDFTKQLEGFQSIYQLNAEQSVKSKAYIAIQALETDLIKIFNIENSKNPPELMVSSSIGLLTKRRGGHPMRLLFFIRPMELLNFDSKKIDGIVETLKTADAAKISIGNSVTVNLEAADRSNKLQITSLFTKGEHGFVYNQMNQTNSMLLPAVFVLKLNKPFPIASTMIDEIKNITGGLKVISEEIKTDIQPSLINLIVTTESQGAYTNGQKGLFVTLADQVHCYFISDNLELTGEVMKSIHFTEPSQVSKIINLLRRQAMFNALVGSCVRKQNQQDLECLMFEINVVSLQLIQVFVEHPILESIVTVEFDLKDTKQVGIKFNGSGQQFDFKFESYITKVFQKTMSIPMVVRSMMKLWNKESEELQAAQRKIFNNGALRVPQNRSNDSREDNEMNEDSVNENFNTMSHDGSVAFDICGINRNEIFFKTDEQQQQQQKNLNADVPTISFESFENKDLMSDLVAESSLSPPSSVMSEDASTKRMQTKFMQKKSTSLDIFEFNDSSPPITSSMLAQMQSPATPSPFGEKRSHELEMMTMKQVMDGSNSCPSFPYEKSKSEKKKKRKREEVEMGSTSLLKKKSSDSLETSPSKKMMSSMTGGKPASFNKPKKSPVMGNFDAMDDLSFLNFPTNDQRNQFI